MTSRTGLLAAAAGTTASATRAVERSRRLRRMSYPLRRRARCDARKGTPISVASLPRSGEAVKHPGQLPEELAPEVGAERLRELERVRLRDVAAVEEGDRVVDDERAEVAVAPGPRGCAEPAARVDETDTGPACVRRDRAVGPRLGPQLPARGGLRRGAAGKQAVGGVAALVRRVADEDH